MARLLVVLLALAVALPAAAAAHNSPSYSTKQVVDAFAAQGITVHSQHVRPSAHWTRFANSGSLRVLVFRSERDANRTIEVDLGARPHNPHRKPGTIVIHLRAPRGSGRPNVHQISFANVAVVYLEGSGLGPGVNTALHSLHHS